LAEDLPLAEFAGDTLFGGDEQGYSDYPAWPMATATNAVLA
jgi:N-ethylmaleimide reductase